MAAATSVKVTQVKNQYLQRYAEFTAAANALDNSGSQDVFSLDVAGLVRIAIHITVATNALAAFAIKGLVSEADTTYVTLKSTAGQFTSPSGILIDTSGDLTAQAVGEGWFVLNVAGFAKIKIFANSAGASSTIALKGSGV